MNEWRRNYCFLWAVAICLQTLPPVTTSFMLQPTTNRYKYSSPLSSVTTDPTSPSQASVTTMTEQEMKIIQDKAEQHAIDNHDNFAMNALFVNIPEQPTPLPCTILNNDGRLPKDLPPGCLLRIGPNGGTKEDGFLDGDGMIHSITLPPQPTNSDDEQQQPMYSATYVQTTGRKLEEQMAKATQSDENKDPVTFKGTLGSAPFAFPMLRNLLENGINFQTLNCQKDTCNTAMAISGKRILALMEQSRPSEISVSKDGSIETIDSMLTLDGTIVEEPITGGSISAHGRTDTTTKERIHVSYSTTSPPFVRVDNFDENWKLKSSWGIDVPAPVMVHDCALSSKYVVVCDFPLTVRPRRFIKNQFPVEYEPTHGARIGLSPRATNGKDKQTRDDTLWFDVDAGVVLHLANAYDRDDGTVVVHGFKAKPKDGSSYILDYTPSFLHEWVIDPAQNKVVVDRCLNIEELVEFPALDDNNVGAMTTYCYGLSTTSIGPLEAFATPKTGILLDGIVKFSIVDDEVNGIAAGDVIGRYTAPSGFHLISEPTIVTKTGGDGHYVLAVATEVPEEGRSDFSDYVQFALDEKKTMKSQLMIFDGDNIESPVCTIQLPSHVNYGLHSLFVPWELMK